MNRIARQVWTFSKMYNLVSNGDLNEWNLFSSPEEKDSTLQKWLSIASLGAHFLKEKGSDENGHFYFSLNRFGNPLIAPYSIFSDCFVAMAMAQFFKVSLHLIINENVGQWSNLGERIGHSNLRKYRKEKGKSKRKVEQIRFRLPLHLIRK